MDSLFKQKLLSLRTPQTPKTFSEALLGDTSWLRTKPKTGKKTAPKTETFSEKAQVLESLERFAQEKVEDLGTTSFKFDGGEVHVKSEISWGEPQGLDEIKLEENLKNLVLKNKIPGEVKAIFISEKFRPWDEVSPELKDGFINELLAGFPLKTAELFMRMIMAMKLDPSEVIIFPVEGSDESDYSQDAMEVAAFFKPEVIITLGAKATQKILKSNDRLSLVHGQFFNRKMGENSFQVVPLFHPSIIETNQNMKKTAWTDMQKIMKHLKKLP